MYTFAEKSDSVIKECPKNEEIVANVIPQQTKAEQRSYLQIHFPNFKLIG